MIYYYFPASVEMNDKLFYECYQNVIYRVFHFKLFKLKIKTPSSASNVLHNNQLLRNSYLISSFTATTECADSAMRLQRAK